MEGIINYVPLKMHHPEGVKLEGWNYHSLFVNNKKVIDYILEQKMQKTKEKI